MSVVQAQYYMKRAIELAAQARALTRPNPRVGAVLVLNDEIVGEGYHHAYGHAHAEVEAIRAAGARAEGATCYVTLEPCAHHGKTPPCIDALVAAKVAKVVMASLDPNPLVQGKGYAYLKEQGIEVEVGICEAEAKALNPAFFQRMQYNKPYYVIKSAMSMDGKTAMQSGQSQWITGPASRELVHALRADADAIVTGIGSILQDNAMLTVRDDAMAQHPLFKQPKRFVLDSSLRIPLSAKILSAPGQTFIITCSKDQQKIQALSELGVQVFVQAQGSQLDLNFVERILLEQGCYHVLVEAGATLVGAYIAADKVDVWHIFTAPKLMGMHTRPLCAWENHDLATAKSFHLADVQRLGDDLHCCYYPITSERELLCSQA